MPDGADGDTPLFTIEHSVEIRATPAEVWAVLMDFERYAEWNPYVLAIAGSTVEGEVLDVKIQQANWPQPLAIQPVVMRAETGRILHWRGRVGDGGILDTDHSFRIEARDETVRFVQREEFRGSWAANLDDESRRFTHDAFRAMNEALGRRVRALQRDE